ncbi:MAG: deoxycytidylate deaminase [Flavobacteriaceae bacterium]|jgi:deoxycytidylate deaminase
MKIIYPYLPSNRTIEYVSENNKFMILAKKVAEEQSTDTNHPTGAVIVLNGEVIGEGANQSALKNDFFKRTHSTWCLRKLFRIKSGLKYWLCPGCASLDSHAERQAIKNTTQLVENADLYLWGHWWCCKTCWNAMISSNIKNVFLLENSKEIFHK